MILMSRAPLPLRLQEALGFVPRAPEVRASENLKYACRSSPLMVVSESLTHDEKRRGPGFRFLCTRNLVL